MRVALYARVSTDEQAKHGLSIDTQIENLRDWAEKAGHVVVGEYIDAGISGKKPPSKRPELSRFFRDVESGMKVEVLLFCKLDRFFRSVKLYYQAIEVMERYGIAWQAIQEDYETLTAGGRMKVNIMLSVAENEADRTAERIKVVFDRKTANGECVNPRGLPLGLTVKNKRVVPNADVDAVRAAFAYYDQCGSIRRTMDFLREEYGIEKLYRSVQKMLENRLYIGEYRDNTSYCEPVIDRALFERVQRGLAKRSVRQNPSNRIYLFSGLAVCAECGQNMGATHNGKGNYHYRCQMAFLNHRCVNRHYYTEKRIEQYLLEHIDTELDNAEASQLSKPQPHKPKVDIAKIHAKLDRLTDLYVDGLISKEKYLADREKISQPLSESIVIPPSPDYSKIREIISSTFRDRYASFTPPQKQSFWHSIIERITIDADGNMRFYFKI